MAEGPSDTPCSCWHRRGTGIPVCATAVVAFVVAFPAVSKARSGHTRAYDLPILLGWSSLIAGSTTLKASVPKGTGGSNPSASATLTSTNTDIMIISRLSVDGGGCISGGIRATR